ncbi:MAG: DUF3800 domain-containing protein [Candidatus Auribacter fodinae]|jgi:hypothetical protein|uniref:DUF3800 domain-containing protein n=1 Tax=Candidatus Auribacter fodinae TaxID=2093366 RepID=A0A3A4QXU2_9BACT|nr:MAG: DUF3800 domain-containing protein [Candidatus Auribacter fodinae]
METIYIDESGYTGHDLLNPHQPIQAVSSLRIDENTAYKLIDQFFPTRKTNELKHIKLSRRKTNHKSLLELQKIILNNYLGITFLSDKRYLLILQFLNDCIEPSYHAQGFNFYRDGHNSALASLIYYTGVAYWGKRNFEELLTFYQRASRYKDDKTLHTLLLKIRFLNVMQNDLSHDVFLLFDESECINEIKKNNFDTDISFSTLIALISHLEKFMAEEYLIIHDTSKNLQKFHKEIEFIINIKKEKSFKITQQTKLTYPLKVKNVVQRDSTSCYGLQLADILVGGAVEFTMAERGLIPKTDYNQEIISLYNDSNCLCLVPSLDFEEQREYQRENQSSEFIDFIAQQKRLQKDKDNTF